MSTLATAVLVHFLDEIKQVKEICDLHFVNPTHLHFQVDCSSETSRSTFGIKPLVQEEN